MKTQRIKVLREKQLQEQILPHQLQTLPVMDIIQPLHHDGKFSVLLAGAQGLFWFILQSRETGWKHGEAIIFFSFYILCN